MILSKPGCRCVGFELLDGGTPKVAETPAAVDVDPNQHRDRRRPAGADLDDRQCRQIAVLDEAVLPVRPTGQEKTPGDCRFCVCRSYLRMPEPIQWPSPNRCRHKRKGRPTDQGADDKQRSGDESTDDGGDEVVGGFAGSQCPPDGNETAEGSTDRVLE